MRKYENVDIVAALGAVVELNTEFYKSDFKYDVEKFKEAAKHPDGENNRFLWLSRHSGTWSFPERDAYIKDTEAFNYWNGNATLLGSPDFYQTVVVQDRILAYAVTVKGFENGRIKGDLYELDYRDHIRHLSKAALPRHTVTASYEDGTTLTLPPAEYDGKRERLYHQHGQVKDFQSDPEDAGALRDILKQARDKREKEAFPAVFKVRVQNVKPRKPSIHDDLKAGKERLARERAAAPQKAAVKSKNDLEV
jgi:hypothetical protein